ncbi:hypothetical protein [Frankia sp. CiP3]|uniref:hypothetical protein n=1 Tax=Frankia sp. CiP3 TaxID=2880971 RepID=UPI001EF6601B|nr:hypothetical protein [Frankia sp. CiP3]
MDDLLVGDLAAQRPVVDGRGELLPDHRGDLLTAVTAEGGPADVAFEVGGPQRLLRGGATQQAFGEQRLERLYSARSCSVLTV